MAEIGEPLSDRELDVLRCVANGAANKEIASELSISSNTVKVHLRNIYAKLGVSSRTEATTAAMQQGYLTIPVRTPTGEPVSAVQVTAVTEAAGEAVPVGPGYNAARPAPVQDRSRLRNWRIIGLLLLLLFSVVAITIMGLQLWNQSQPVATPEPFVESPLGDSRWLVSRPMPEGRADMAVAAVGLDIYQIGGETTEGIDGKVYVFDSVERQWSEAASKPTAVKDSSAVELYGEIYVPGGLLPDGDPTAVVEAYSPSQNAWRPIAALPQPISGGLALSNGAFLYLFGGWDGEKYLDTAFMYDPSADSWRPLPPMPQAVAQAAGGVLAGKLVVAGGANGETELATCHIFDPGSEQWSSCPDMLIPRAGAGSAVILNKLYIIGGGLGSENAVTFSEVYDPTSETWQVVNTPILKENGRWPGAGVGNVETRIYALGGRSGESFMDDTLVYAPLVYQTFIPAASSGNEE